MTVTVLVPTLNEIKGLKELMPRIRGDWYDQLLVIDGGSTDGSLEYAESKGYDLIRQARPGMRMAYIQAYPRIRGDIVITFSPDGNSIPEAIPQLVAKIQEGYDMVIASRYLAGAKSADDTPLTRLGNYLFTRMISRFGYPYTDAMVMFRAYRRQVPEKLGLTKIRGDLYEKYLGRYVSWEPLMSIRCAKMGMRISEIPSDEPRRVGDGPDALFLRATRIHHFRAGFACFLQVLEEAMRRRDRGS